MLVKKAFATAAILCGLSPPVLLDLAPSQTYTF
jgi:hypothetical protein